MRSKEFAGLSALFLAAAWARAQGGSGTYDKMAPLEQYLIADRNAEIALARSAAPPSISNDASVLVLTPRGYLTAVEGKNGFVCFVDRSWESDFDDPGFWNPRKRGPTCMNPAAVRSVLPLVRRRTEMALTGLSREEILARLKDGVAKKEFPRPEIGSMSYMMSKEQYLGDTNPHWHPHLMFYVPGETNPETWGANLAASPVFGGGQDLPGGGRMPWTIFFVPIPQWSDGTPAEYHSAAEK
jgi:predicted DNA-binding transcriptional regulator AlpA